MRAMLALRSAPDGYENQPKTEQIAMLRRVYADAGWQTQRIPYAPSPLTGKGTSLALIGAYLLAGELGRGDDLTAAFRRYGLLMRPRVLAAQKLPPGTARLALPGSTLGVGMIRGVTKVIASRPAAALRGRLSHGGKEQAPSTLPPYGALTAADMNPLPAAS